MKVLLTRFGGIGDSFPVMVTAKALADRGDEVTIGLRDDGSRVKQTALFDNYSEFKFLNMKEVGPWSTRCVDIDHGQASIQTVYKNYDLVVDYMNCVENNSTSPWNNMRDQWEFWQRSRSSNYVNWYDMHLAWANIDPTKVVDKRPFLKLSDEELERAEQLKAKYTKIFVIHPFASSLARSWYQAKELCPKLTKEYPGCAVCFWNPRDNNWDLITKTSFTKLEKLVENPLRETLVLLKASELVVCVDTGTAHMAEALDQKALVLYSTVPAWTRNAYYKYQHHIDLGSKKPEYYTFSLGLGDPLRVKDGVSVLSEREKLVSELWTRKASPQEAMAALNTDYQGAEMELKIFMARQETWERQQSKALSDITVDMVFKRIKELAK